MSSIVPFPAFPVEIIREIVEAALLPDLESASGPASTALLADSALSLMSVCRCFRTWSLPLVYETISLSTASSVTIFERCIASAGDFSAKHLNPIPLTDYVKNLGIFALGPLPSILKILSSCKNVQSLACGFFMSSYSATTALSLPCPDDLHLLSLSCRDGVHFSTMVPSTTHLHVQISIRHLASLNFIRNHLPCLTHLAVSLPSTAVKAWNSVLPELISILETNSELKVFYVQVSRSSNAGGIDPTKTEVSDSRLVVSHAPMSCIAQWTKTLRGEEDGLWKYAEKRIHGRNDCADRKEKEAYDELLFSHQTFAGLRRFTRLDSTHTGAF